MAKEITSRQKEITSWQKSKSHGKRNNLKAKVKDSKLAKEITMS